MCARPTEKMAVVAEVTMKRSVESVTLTIEEWEQIDALLDYLSVRSCSATMDKLVTSAQLVGLAVFQKIREAKAA